MKTPKFHIGDTVTWEGAPNELSANRQGVIVAIKKNIAYITHPYAGVGEFAKLFGGNFNKMVTPGQKLRQVPVKLLKHI